MTYLIYTALWYVFLGKNGKAKGKLVDYCSNLIYDLSQNIIFHKVSKLENYLSNY